MLATELTLRLDNVTVCAGCWILYGLISPVCSLAPCANCCPRANDPPLPSIGNQLLDIYFLILLNIFFFFFFWKQFNVVILMFRCVEIIFKKGKRENIFEV